jgi:hypothetical protein
MSDGTVVDLSGYDESDVLISYRVMPSGEIQFVDFTIFES